MNVRTKLNSLNVYSALDLISGWKWERTNEFVDVEQTWQQSCKHSSFPLLLQQLIKLKNLYVLHKTIEYALSFGYGIGFRLVSFFFLRYFRTSCTFFVTVSEWIKLCVCKNTSTEKKHKFSFLWEWNVDFLFSYSHTSEYLWEKSKLPGK